jgi:hypothetical protein
MLYLDGQFAEIHSGALHAPRPYAWAIIMSSSSSSCDNPNVRPTVVVREAALLRRVIARGMGGLWAPHAKRALAVCLLGACGLQKEYPRQRQRQQQQPRQRHDVNHAATLSISVEAVGSGVVLVPTLSVSREVTVGELKRMLLDHAVAPHAAVAPPSIRLFAGHGGEELCDEDRSLSAYAVADGTTLVQVSVDDRYALARLFHRSGLTACAIDAADNQSGLEDWPDEAAPPAARFGAPLHCWRGVTIDEDSGRAIKVESEATGDRIRRGSWGLCRCLCFFVGVVAAVVVVILVVAGRVNIAPTLHLAASTRARWD